MVYLSLEMMSMMFVRRFSSLPKKRKINFPALEEYKKIHGNLKIPSTFQVPVNVQWSEEFHGLKLGSHVNNIAFKFRNDPNVFDKDELSKFNQIGLVLDVRKCEQN